MVSMLQTTVSKFMQEENEIFEDRNGLLMKNNI